MAANFGAIKSLADRQGLEQAMMHGRREYTSISLIRSSQFSNAVAGRGTTANMKKHGGSEDKGYE